MIHNAKDAMEKDFNERKFIYILKSIAVFSIVCAHCGYVTLSFSKLNLFFSNFLQSIGSIGVGVFFVLSGYLLYKNNKKIIVFFRNKVKTILVPWIICGTAVYGYTNIRKGGLSLRGWLNWIIGNPSYLYYLFVLIILYLVYFYFTKSRVFCIVTIIISIISNVITSLEIFKSIGISFNPYINPFNWMIFFSVGIFIAQKNALARLSVKAENYLVITGILSIMSILIFSVSGNILSYWKAYYLIFAFIIIFFVFGLSYKIVNNNKNNEIIEFIGKESFSIYLLHMPFAGLIANLLNRKDLWWTTPFRPFIVLSLIGILIYFYKKVAKIINKEKSLNMLIGSR
jgi:peptidoglycan/LPS O-acetylase OafA/YrhL